MDKLVNDQLFNQLNLPLQDLHQLSFCGYKPNQVQAWLDSLPTTKTKHTGIIFYKLLPEVSRLTIKSSQKIAILELLRNPVQQCIEGLAKDFLDQALSLPETSAKIAAIAQALQRHLGDSYLSICHDLSTKMNAAKSISASSKKELSLVVSRALYSLGQLLYRNHQLYIPQTSIFWYKLSYLQQVISHFQLEELAIDDELLERHQGHRIKDSLLRPLLLNCSHTNQLNQRDITYLYGLLEEWCCQAQLIDAQNDKAEQQCLYWVNFQSGQGPMYRHRFANKPNDTLAINLTHLHRTLQKSSENILNNSYKDIPQQNKRSLLNHLLNCWQNTQQRKEDRSESHATMQICIGLSAAHTQLSNGMSFQEFIREENSKQNDELYIDNVIAGDVGVNYNQTFNEHRYGAITGSKTSEDTHSVMATDISDHGYCLKWSRDVEMPKNVKNGEVIIIKQNEQDDWQVGIIRWAQRLNKDSYIGIERLSQQAIPYAISATLDNGQESPFFRAILLNKHSNNEVGNVLVPSIPFAINQKVSLNQYGKQARALLTQQVGYSDSISHYLYQQLN